MYVLKLLKEASGMFLLKYVNFIAQTWNCPPKPWGGQLGEIDISRMKCGTVGQALGICKVSRVKCGTILQVLEKTVR